ncbi:MAG TPA: hypothetical protein VM901_07170 [Bdellovibrionota bacterium]|nr:hypothetical protein [Bdellovibrionota bacterium]
MIKTKGTLALRAALVGVAALSGLGAQAAITCSPRPPLYFAVSGNGKFMHNVCTETGIDKADCYNKNQNAPHNPGFKNGEVDPDRLWTGFETVSVPSPTGQPTKYGHHELHEMLQAIGAYFDNNPTTSPAAQNDGVLDERDCKPFRVAIVGYSNGAWAAAMVVAAMNKIGYTGVGPSLFNDWFGWGEDKKGKKIANFKGHFEIRLGLIDTVPLTESGWWGLVPNMDKIGGVNPHADLPVSNAIIYNLHQQNGCSTKYCRTKAGPIPLPFLNGLLKGERWRGTIGGVNAGLKAFIDFDRQLTSVQTRVDSSSLQTQAASHINIEVPAFDAAEFIYHPGASGWLSNGSLPGGTTTNQTASLDPVGDADALIAAIGTSSTRTSVTDAASVVLSAERVDAALETIVLLRSRALAAATLIALHPTHDISLAITERATAYGSLTGLPTGANGELAFGTQAIEHAGAGQGAPIWVNYTVNSDFAAYVTQFDMWNQLANPGLFKPMYLPQLSTRQTDGLFVLKNHSVKRFYKTNVDDPYQVNLRLLTDALTPSAPGALTPATLASSTSLLKWSPVVKVWIPKTFTEDALPNTTSFYPWDFALEGDTDYGEWMEAPVEALDFTQGKVRVLLSGTNVEILRNDGAGNWNVFEDTYAPTAHPTTLINDGAELKALFQNLGFKITNPLETSTLTVEFEFIRNRGSDARFVKTINLNTPDVGTISSSSVDTPARDFKKILANELWNVATY